MTAAEQSADAVDDNRQGSYYRPPLGGRLPWPKLALFASPALPLAALTIPLNVYLPNYYVSGVGLDIGTVGLLFMLARLFDVLIDPIMGSVSDRLGVPIGRRRFWILVAAPIVVVSTYFLYLPAKDATYEYLAFSLFCLYVGYTFLMIPLLSLAGDLSSDYHERSRIQGAVSLASSAGILGALAFAAVAEGFYAADPGRARMTALAGFVMILTPITALLCATAVREPKGESEPAAGWRDTWRVIAGNGYIGRVLLADLLYGITVGIVSAVLIFYLTRVARVENASLMLLFYFGGSIASVPFWLHVARRFSKHVAWRCMCLTAVPTLLIWLVMPSGSAVAAALALTFYGFSNGNCILILRSMIADFADQDELETGRRQTGFYFGLITMTSKVGLGLSVGFSFILLKWFGFDPANTTSLSAGARLGLDLSMIYVPSALFIVMAALLWRYPLDGRRHSELRAALQNRRARA